MKQKKPERKKLTDLNPRWVGVGGPDIRDANGNPKPRREKIGFGFDCPCGCGDRTYVLFTNPLDGGPPADPNGRHTWERTGTTFEDLTVKPSIRKLDDCKWHGFVENGMVRTV